MTEWTDEEKRALAEHCRKIGWIERSPGYWEAPEDWRPENYEEVMRQ